MVGRAAVELLHVRRLHISPPARHRMHPHQRHELAQRQSQPLRYELDMRHRLRRCTARRNQRAQRRITVLQQPSKCQGCVHISAKNWHSCRPSLSAVTLTCATGCSCCTALAGRSQLDFTSIIRGTFSCCVCRIMCLAGRM